MVTASSLGKNDNGRFKGRGNERSAILTLLNTLFTYYCSRGTTLVSCEDLKTIEDRMGNKDKIIVMIACTIM